MEQNTRFQRFCGIKISYRVRNFKKKRWGNMNSSFIFEKVVLLLFCALVKVSLTIEKYHIFSRLAFGFTLLIIAVSN